MPTIYDDPGPNPDNGDSQASGSWSATVGGDDAFVLGKTQRSVFWMPNWWTRPTIEASILRFAEETDGESIAVVLTRAGVTITDLTKVHFYPKELRPSDLSISGSGVSFTMVAGDQFTVVYDDRAVTASSSSDTMSELAATAYMPPLFIQCLTEQVDPTGTIVDWDGTQDSVAAGTTLRFPVTGTVADLPVGGLDVEAGGKVYIPGGKLVRGRIRSEGSNSRVHGHGFWSGETVLWEDLQGMDFEDQFDFSMFRMTAASASNVLVDGVCIVCSPFYNIVGATGGSEFMVVSIWNPNSDGIIPHRPADGTPWLFEDFLCVVGDDCMHSAEYQGVGQYRNFVAGTVSGTSMDAGYWPATRVSAGLPATWLNGHVIAFQTYFQVPNESSPAGARYGHIFRAWSDGETGEESHVIADYAVQNVRVDGDVDGNIRAKPWSLHNFPFPWSVRDGLGGWDPGVADQIGNIFNIRFNGFRFESAARDAGADGAIIRADVIGLDADNTPHDLTFADVTFGSSLLTVSNWSVYVQHNSYVYSVTVNGIVMIPAPDGGGGGGGGGGVLIPGDPPTIPPSGGTALEDSALLWASVVGSYDNAGLVQLTNIRDPNQTTVNATVGAAAAQTVIDLWPLYAQCEYDASNRQHVTVALRGVIAILWQRGGAAQSIAKVEFDEVFSDEGMVARVKKTGPRGRQVPVTNSGVRTSSELRNGRAVMGWSDRDALPHGILPSQRLARE